MLRPLDSALRCLRFNLCLSIPQVFLFTILDYLLKDSWIVPIHIHIGSPRSVQKFELSKIGFLDSALPSLEVSLVPSNSITCGNLESVFSIRILTVSWLREPGVAFRFHLYVSIPQGFLFDFLASLLKNSWIVSCVTRRFHLRLPFKIHLGSPGNVSATEVRMFFGLSM